ncbi:hypothetical protein BBF96_05185 [Anoxybacter fermentans]|uniref:Methyltransferase type 11 domain-containing protein n=1 Tax=Anoxybacter fermentans TaxID=1323375 RepID=A0A3Q9HPU0_9FIRM|nr:class I SAM-dependent methyltransferase [Anoxybacter fermentans]AZR72836.1 hypothetical protein BBF96_05185 [Anoxybacter fermentans]
MPEICTHIYFARLVLDKVKIPYDLHYFIQGTVAPDSFIYENPEIFHKYHFVNNDLEFDLEFFLRTVGEYCKTSDSYLKSFIDGYYTHLWLDDYVRKNADKLEIINLGNMARLKLKDLFKINIRWYDFNDISSLLEGIVEKPIIALSLPGLEFISFDAIKHLLQQQVEVLKETLNVSTELVVIPRDKYNRFMSDAADKLAGFLNCVSKENLIDKVKALALAKIKEIEKLPDIAKDSNEKDLKKYKYPFERDLESYKRKLPDLERALIKANKVLEIGAGKGIAASQIKELYGCDIYATGITEIENFPVPFTIAVASNLPFSDETFDLVISVQAISWEADQIKALKEVIRVLKPGGMALLFLTTFSYSMEHRWGKSFWIEAEIDPQDYKKYEFSPDIKINGCKIETFEVPMKHPFKEHKFAYYVKITKEDRNI